MVVLDVRLVVSGKILVVHVQRFARVHLVVHDVEVHLEDHTEQSIAPQRVAEEFGILGRAGFHNVAIA